jgi:pyruvate ferredoxin oxidoreductase gamma subunit
MLPDALIIQDPTLLHQVDVFAGLSRGGMILINTSRSFAELGLEDFIENFKVCALPASELALKHLGRPVPNAALLGGFAALSHKISLDSVTAAINRKFSGKVAAGNVAAATEAYRHAQAD